MNMPKSRDIQAKIPLPQAIWNEFWLSYCERSEQSRIFSKVQLFLHILLDKKVSNDTLLNVLFFKKGRNNIGKIFTKGRNF